MVTDLVTSWLGYMAGYFNILQSGDGVLRLVNRVFVEIMPFLAAFCKVAKNRS
jgi:hypothetical protein